MSAAGALSSRRSHVQESTSICRCRPYVSHFLDLPEQLSPMSRRQDFCSGVPEHVSATSTMTGPCAGHVQGVGERGRAAQKDPTLEGSPWPTTLHTVFQVRFMTKSENCSQRCSGAPENAVTGPPALTVADSPHAFPAVFPPPMYCSLLLISAS